MLPARGADSPLSLSPFLHTVLHCASLWSRPHKICLLCWGLPAGCRRVLNGSSELRLAVRSVGYVWVPALVSISRDRCDTSVIQGRVISH